jgi:hypothetical protein
MNRLTIPQKADTLGTFRFVLVRLMETLARWVPTSPELEVKTLFGRHIWLLAQHADAIGHRTVELRAKLHYDRRPLEAYGGVLGAVADAPTSGDRLAAVYDALLPDFSGRLQQYLATTDQLLDAPSVDIIKRILADFERMQNDRREAELERPDVRANAVLAQALCQRLEACRDFVDYREPVAS